jgi:hypothetical protein
MGDADVFEYVVEEFVWLLEISEKLRRHGQRRWYGHKEAFFASDYHYRRRGGVVDALNIAKV